MNRLTDVVKNLIIINVIVFVAVQTLPGQFQDYGRLGALYHFQSDRFYPFQIVTSMFMHADFRHLLMNMLGLFFLGPMVEASLGPKRFFILYILAGLVGSIATVVVHYFGAASLFNSIDPDTLQMLMTDGAGYLEAGKNYSDPTLNNLNLKIFRATNMGVKGASGCVYGVVLAFATMFPNMKLKLLLLPIEIPGAFVGFVSVAFAIYGGFGGIDDGIAHFAHLGGALIGFLLIHYWKMANLR